ncbi:hypothetical protein EYC80_002029 [Monilinia laxa]|uniref:Uncharacterized protein n=1 Tax=Monilinia laxa TaxID=61186 RepID=A0A5N6K6Y5_MONLA|nr:hypothetical protein EYC80_002029 [Monilinia laxa]
MLAELKAVPEFTIIAVEFGYTLEKVAANVVALIPLINSLPPDAPEAVNFEIVSAKSIKTIWVVMCGFAAAGLIASCFIKGYDLDQALVTDQGFAIGVKKVDPERLQVDTKARESKKSNVSVEEQSVKESGPEKPSATQKLPKESEWENLALLGKRKSRKANCSEKGKLPAEKKSEYSKMVEEDTCPIFGKHD